ncbi:MAG: hypothetical protein ACYCY1_16980, partial [Sulfuriferula sp.]
GRFDIDQTWCASQVFEMSFAQAVKPLHAATLSDARLGIIQDRASSPEIQCNRRMQADAAKARCCVRNRHWHRASCSPAKTGSVYPRYQRAAGNARCACVLKRSATVLDLPLTSDMPHARNNMHR